MSIKDKIRAYIVENHFFGDNDESVADNESLLGSGVIDSTGVLDVVEFLESDFEIQVLDEEMVPENLDSIDAIAAFVDRKRSG